ncbi:DUF4148 domain-containing protein [Burkholderia multivorans]|uniref:DUF4148 domain-containing protein n=1 Tax=Burkholderia multivorans TaxID=87883 RepID=UPI0021C1A2F0|nr:DUF4148 domain-containing protein [Burkholderia multivorans]
MNVIAHVTLATLFAIGSVESAFAQSAEKGEAGSAPVVTAQRSIGETTDTANESNSQTTGKTRADVYHELVQAQHDGQLDLLNRTIYRNP